MRGWRLWAIWGLAAIGGVFWFLKPIRHALLLGILPLVGKSMPQWDGHKTPLYWLDVRELAEYQVSHLPKARWVGSRDFRLETLSDIPKDAPIVVYCSVGIRSQRAGQEMLAAGYTQVWNLNGGIFKWLADGHVVVDMQAQSTQNVHPYDALWGIFAPVGIWRREP